MEGIITSIQRMSIHDGPGIRTTVFMKGCNLRCEWCHNPETWSKKNQLQYFQDKCLNCKKCIEACHKDALKMTVDGLLIDRNKCTNCGDCLSNCFSEALTMVGKKVAVDEVMKILLQDKAFYQESKGGVTISGGEPLLQRGFIKELLIACKQKNIHTAIETNLYSNWEIIEDLLPFVDLWMCDLKIANTAIHKLHTGHANEIIIKNLKNLSVRNVPMIVRTPVIPGINDTTNAISGICNIIKDMKNIIYYELLGFHSLGFNKFGSLGMINPLTNTEFMRREDLTKLYEIPYKLGINLKHKIA